MTDQAAQPQAGAEKVETQAVTPPVEADEFNKDRAMATIEKLRQFEKDAKAYKKRLDELEAADIKRKEAELSETDKLKAQLVKATNDLNALRLTELKRQAGAKFKLPEAFITRLNGTTLEELEADAEALAKALPKQTIPPTNPGMTQTGETREQQRARLFGGQKADLWDPATAAKHGGGVVFTTSTKQED